MILVARTEMRGHDLGFSWLRTTRDGKMNLAGDGEKEVENVSAGTRDHGSVLVPFEMSGQPAHVWELHCPTCGDGTMDRVFDEDG